MKLLLRGPTELLLSEFDSPSFEVYGNAGGEGYGPLQMFAGSLGLCTAAVLQSYDQNVLGLGTDSLQLVVRWSYSERPYRVGSMDVEVIWPGLPAERVKSVERAASSCTIHHTLAHPPEVSTSVHRNRPTSSEWSQQAPHQP